jgi:hypothetical protein
VDPTEPPDWPDGWVWPNPWVEPITYPPGWPKDYTDSDGNPTHKVVTTVPASFKEDAAITVEGEIQTIAGASTSDFDNWIVRVTAVVGAVTIGMKQAVGDDYSNELQFDVSNYSGAKYGISESLYFDVDDYEGDDLVVSVEVLGVTSASQLSDDDTSDILADYITVTAPATIYDNTKHQITCDIYDSDDADEDEYNTENMVITASVGGSAVNVKKLRGDAWASSVSFTISNYTGSKHGIQEDMYFDLDGESGTVTVTATAASNAFTVGTDTATVAANGDYLVASADVSNVVRAVDFTLTITAKDALDSTITASSDTVTVSVTPTDASDGVYDNDVLMTTVDLSSGVWTSSTVSIEGGSGPGDSTTIDASATGFISGSTSTINLNVPGNEDAVDKYAENSRSAVWFSGSWTGLGANNSGGWSSEFTQARNGTLFGSTIFSTGDFNDFTDVGVVMHHANMENGYGDGPAAAIGRSQFRFDVSSYKGGVISAVLRITPTTFVWEWDGTPWSNDTNGSVEVYSSTSDVTTGSADIIFDSILTNASGGTLEDSITVDACKTQYDANGYIDFTISAANINSVSDDYFRVVLITDYDYDNTSESYPGTGTSYVRPKFYLEGSAQLRMT